MVPAKCMYKATINTKLEDLVKNYIDYIDHVFFRNLADVSLTDEDTNSILSDNAITTNNSIYISPTQTDF